MFTVRFVDLSSCIEHTSNLLVVVAVVVVDFVVVEGCNVFKSVVTGGRRLVVAVLAVKIKMLILMYP